MSTALSRRARLRRRLWGEFFHSFYAITTSAHDAYSLPSLQRFKLNIANSVVTQQNAGLESMDTDLVLDLFKHTTEEEDARAAKKRADRGRSGGAAAGLPGKSNILEGLGDLPTEEEYEGLDISSYMSSLGR